MIRLALPPEREEQRKQRDAQAIRQRIPALETLMTRGKGGFYKVAGGGVSERHNFFQASLRREVDESEELERLGAATSPQEAQNCATLIRLASARPEGTLMDVCTNALDSGNRPVMEGLVADIHDIAMGGGLEERPRALGLLMGMAEEKVQKAKDALVQLGLLEKDCRRGLKEFIRHLALPAFGAAAGVCFVDFELALVAVGIGILAKIVGEKVKEDNIAEQ